MYNFSKNNNEVCCCPDEFAENNYEDCSCTWACFNKVCSH